MWTLRWEDDAPHAVSSLEQLNGLLDELASSHSEDNPLLVQLRAPNGEALMIGIGGDLVVLDHLAAGGWPAKHSLGNPNDEGTIPYMMGSHRSEMSRSYGIPARLGRRAVEHFYISGELLDEIIWEDD